MIDLPVGWEITDSVEPTYGIPDFELIIRCATKEIAEKTAQLFLDSEKNQMIIKRLQDKIQSLYELKKECELTGDEPDYDVDQSLKDLNNILHNTVEVDGLE